jgi:hypothetical protein
MIEKYIFTLSYDIQNAKWQVTARALKHILPLKAFKTEPLFYN